MKHIKFHSIITDWDGKILKSRLRTLAQDDWPIDSIEQDEKKWDDNFTSTVKILPITLHSRRLRHRHLTDGHQVGEEYEDDAGGRPDVHVRHVGHLG